MKIGITCYPTAGGSGIMATELGKRLAGLGHEVHFITSALPIRLRGFVENIYFHEVVPEAYPLFQYPPYEVSLATRMHDVALQYGLDILHVHYAIPHAVSAFLAQEMLKPRKITTVTTLHGTDITLVGVLPSFHRLTRFSIERSNGVTAVSEWLKRQTDEKFPMERPITVIPNFIDTKLFRPVDNPRARCRLGPADEKIIMHISNFRPVKNIEAVIRVFAGITAKLPCRLALVGDGPELARADALARQLGVHNRVLFLGNQEFVEEILPAADLFLLPSHHESFGLSALEAMSAGVPVIATNQGGPLEVVDDGVTGYLRGPDDVAGMVSAGLEVLGDRDRAARMGEASRQSAIDKYDIDRVVPRYVDFYRATLESS
ncbi:MAG: N-acetyl-alpha-D-glucosaminyl L-malate synthase BshA [Candidatus Eisenbacteria bacterium]|nr:N-acetyl-alpha-D-glucosaminyl L-malate synthase BshA [Candidatus Eisenbacteria bacterium]